MMRFIEISFTLEMQHYRAARILQKSCGCFICLNVRSGLNSENLQEDISGGAGSNSPIDWGNQEGCNIIRCYAGRQCKKLRFPSFWPAICSQPDYALRDPFLAAILLTADAGNLPMHGALHAQPAHRHAAAMSARSTIGIPHGAEQSGKGRLSRERCNHGQSDDLEKPLHQLNPDYIWQAA